MNTIQVSKSQNSAIMRPGRSASPGGSQQRSNIDWNSIKKFKLQNMNLREEINLEEKSSQNYEQKMMQKLYNYQNEGSNLAKKIEIENKRHQILQKEIFVTKLEIANKKKQFQGQGENNVSDTIQKLKILEHRQEKYMQKNNELFAAILKTKDHLKATRRERVIFDNIFTNIESDLKKKEEEIKSLTLVSSQIDVYKSELECLQQQISQIDYLEQQYFSQMCQQTLKNPELIDQVDLEDEEKQLSQKQSSYESSNSQDGVSDVDPIELQLTLNSNQQMLEKTENDQDQQSQLLQNAKSVQQEIEYNEQLLETLKTKCENKNIDDFLYHIQTSTDMNQQLFDECSSLQEKINTLEHQIKELDNHPIDQPENTQRIDMMDRKNEPEEEKQILIHQINKLDDNYNQYNIETEQIVETLQQASQIFPELLEKIDCISDDYMKDNIHLNVHPNNILDFVKVIEQKVDEVTQLENAISKNNLYGKVYGQLPFNLKLIKEKNSRLQYINDVIDNLEKQKEGDKIMSIKEFQQSSVKEVQKHMSRPKRLQTQQSGNDFQQRPSVKKQSFIQQSGSLINYNPSVENKKRQSEKLNKSNQQNSKNKNNNDNSNYSNNNEDSDKSMESQNNISHISDDKK